MTRRRRSRLWLLGALGLTALGCAPGGAEAEAVRGPNVLVLVWDTVRADRTSAYGYERPTTPRLEELAAESVRFERAISASNWTVPGHASLFTGLPVRAHGASYAYPWLNGRFETLAETLGGAGYDTYAFSANVHFGEETNLHQGFDRFEHPWHEPWSARLEALGRTLPAQEKDAADLAGEALLAWLDGRAPDGAAPGPFFAVLNMMEAHLPVRPSEEARAALMTPAQAAGSRGWDAEPPPLIAWMLRGRAASAEELDLVGANYDAALFDLDRRTGALLDALRARGVLDETLVVLTADHGENLGERGMFDHKFCAYDTLLHVPLVVRPPGGTAGRTVSAAVSSIDVHATLLAAAGLEPPAEARGRDLLADSLEARPVLAETLASRPNLLVKHAAAVEDFDWPRWQRRFQTIEFRGEKLIRTSEGERELYRVSADPGETRDLSAIEVQRRERLERALDDWRDGVAAFDPSEENEGMLRVMDPETEERLRQLGYIGDS